MAQCINKLTSKMQLALLGDQMLPLYIEWCPRLDARVPGFACDDTCLLFDHDGENTCLVTKGPERNVYVEIPFPLLDPVKEMHSAALESFFATTYWDNGPALELLLCGIALALRGMNVERAIIGVGSGGVGQSILTAVLANLLGKRHAYVDMNVYHDDAEMRKQSAHLFNKLVITGQEAVQGSHQKLRQHVFKKHISADPLPQRKNYSIDTHMIELIGLKRYELNNFFSLDGITEENVDSMLRRSAVTMYKSRFYNKEYIQRHVPNAAARGIFPKDLAGFTTRVYGGH